MTALFSIVSYPYGALFVLGGKSFNVISTEGCAIFDWEKREEREGGERESGGGDCKIFRFFCIIITITITINITTPSSLSLLSPSLSLLLNTTYSNIRMCVHLKRRVLCEDNVISSEGCAIFSDDWRKERRREREWTGMGERVWSWGELLCCCCCFLCFKDIWSLTIHRL